MKKNLVTKENHNPVIECAVCGKQFPRGLVDLSRHVNAATLQHLFANCQSASFPFGCENCGLHFTKEEHLTCHNQFSSCGLGGLGTTLHTDESNLSGETRDVNGDESSAKIDDLLMQDDSNRTLECMVCGKLFPRGPVDLQRHATAVTLKHLVSSKRSSTFSHGCGRCGLWMTTAEHLKSHEMNSTCNPDMVWPDNAHSMAGLRTVTRAELTKMQQQAQSLSSPKPNALVLPQKATADYNAINMDIASPLGSRKRTIKRRYGDDDSPYFAHPTQKSAVDNTIEVVDPASDNEQYSSSEGRKRLNKIVQDDLSLARQKKAKVIVPEERQTFFSIVSLLIEPRSVPLTTKITEDNYEQFIPDHHKHLLSKLKKCLLYE